MLSMTSGEGASAFFTDVIRNVSRENVAVPIQSRNCQSLIAAFLFAISVPIAKLLLAGVGPQWLAAFLYLGSGIGLALQTMLSRKEGTGEAPLRRRHFPALAGAIMCGGVLGPVLLLVGLRNTPASSASLLLNFEGVFTALVAWAIFHENLGRRIVLGMARYRGGWCPPLMERHGIP